MKYALVVGLALGLVAGRGVCAQGPQQGERFLVYKVERIDKANAPVIDGKLDEQVWKDKAVLAGLRNFIANKGFLNEVISQRTEFVVLTDGAMLYVGVTFWDDAMQSMWSNPTAGACWNDCAEFYFDPLHDGTRIIQLAVDCLNQRYWHRSVDDGAGHYDDSGWYMLAKWNSAVNREKDRWTIEIAIDCASFGIAPAPGSVCRFNPCRFRLGKWELAAWGMAGGETGRQKDPNYWGYLVFGAPDERMKDAPVTRRDVSRVYPDMGSRTLEFPVADGFLVFTDKKEQIVKFSDRLSALGTAAAASLVKAKDQIAVLAQGDPTRLGFQKDWEKMDTEFSPFREMIKASPLTIGVYDKAAAGLEKAKDKTDDLYWKARLAALAAEADAETVKP